MNNNRRRNFQADNKRIIFEEECHPILQSMAISNNQGNRNFNRNGSLANPASIEKVINKYQQLAKDAQKVEIQFL